METVALIVCGGGKCTEKGFVSFNSIPMAASSPCSPDRRKPPSIDEFYVFKKRRPSDSEVL